MQNGERRQYSCVPSFPPVIVKYSKEVSKHLPIVYWIIMIFSVFFHKLYVIYVVIFATLKKSFTQSEYMGYTVETDKWVE